MIPGGPYHFVTKVEALESLDHFRTDPTSSNHRTPSCAYLLFAYEEDVRDTSSVRRPRGHIPYLPSRLNAVLDRTRSTSRP